MSTRAEKYQRRRVQTGDAGDRDFHLRRVCESFPTTITPAALRRLADLGSDDPAEEMTEK